MQQVFWLGFQILDFRSVDFSSHLQIDQSQSHHFRPILCSTLPIAITGLYLHLQNPQTRRYFVANSKLYFVGAYLMSPSFQLNFELIVGQMMY